MQFYSFILHLFQGYRPYCKLEKIFYQLDLFFLTILDRETNPQYGQSITSNGDSVLTCGHLWSRAPPQYNFQGQCILSKKNLDKPTYIVGACDNGKAVVQ